MNLRQLFTAALLLLAGCGAAFAKNSTQQLSPQSAKDLGISVTAEPGKDGTVQVTISRDLSKLRAIPADADVEVCRTATLSVDGDSGLVLRCNLAGEAAKGAVVYRFTLGKKLAGQSRLSIAEMICRKDRGPAVAQGNTFIFQIADFIGK
jgi:hypothetical protein